MRDWKKSSTFAADLIEGTRKRFPRLIEIMITKEQIKTLAEEFLQKTDYQLQVVEIDKENNILVEIDRPGVVDVDFCAALNRFLVDRLGNEDYSLEVGSISITAPFISKLQYQKNLGHEVEVMAKGERLKVKGILVSVDDETFAIDTEVMVAVEGKKRKVKQIQTMEFRYDAAQTRYDLKV